MPKFSLVYNRNSGSANPQTTRGTSHSTFLLFPVAISMHQFLPTCEFISLDNIFLAFGVASLFASVTDADCLALNDLYPYFDMFMFLHSITFFKKSVRPAQVETALRQTHVNYTFRYIVALL